LLALRVIIIRGAGKDVFPHIKEKAHTHQENRWLQDSHGTEMASEGGSAQQ